MTKAQEYLHWKRWGLVVRANQWRMKGGRLADGAAGKERSEHHAVVWTYALQLALRAHRAVTPDDLRHGSYCAAIGRDCSHGELSNREFNQVLSFWGLLIDPHNLQAVMETQHPEIAEMRGLVRSIRRKAPSESYIIAITRRKYGTANWETDLGLPALRQLVMTLSNKARSEAGRARSAGAMASNDPF